MVINLDNSPEQISLKFKSKYKNSRLRDESRFVLASLEK